MKSFLEFLSTHGGALPLHLIQGDIRLWVQSAICYGFAAQRRNVVTLTSHGRVHLASVNFLYWARMAERVRAGLVLH